MAHHLLFYELASDYLERRPGFRDAHLALAWAASERGELLLGGAVGDPVESALLLFTHADAARAFAEADPYVIEGLVAHWHVQPWNTVVGAEAANPVRPG
ncbi:YciI-like protein [Sphingomonas sp. HF-S4]|uniref:YciI-like protein n=1 Tax=Sphingomonas agrestis TaxID=3080540 RepID=A0ABU3YBC1_9SPHN|nr:YciI-like protein [Sphingomonas sp. HF-S4]MDV3458695.1 YciI-like protein [Sphingomonas sp. HF-S4]